MDGTNVYRESLTRYRSQWRWFVFVPWAVTLVMEVASLIFKQWDIGLTLDAVSHLLLLSPIGAWGIGRRALRLHPLDLQHSSGSEQREIQSTAQTYRSQPIFVPAGAGDGPEAWVVTGVFPHWALVMTSLYVSFEAAAWCLVGAVSFWYLFVPLLVVGRSCLFSAWLARVGRDASRVAVLECGADRRPEELAFCGKDGKLRASVVRFDEPSLTLHLDISGSAAVWSVVPPNDAGRVGRGWTGPLGAGNARQDREKQSD